MAETVDRLEGHHASSRPTRRARSSSPAEFSYITYDTNWQAWGDDSKSITNTLYPAMEP